MILPDIGGDDFRQQVRHVHHDLLGRLEGLRLDLGEEMAGEMIEPERDDERDEEQGDAGETHGG